MSKTQKQTIVRGTEEIEKTQVKRLIDAYQVVSLSITYQKP